MKNSVANEEIERVSLSETDMHSIGDYIALSETVPVCMPGRHSGFRCMVKRWADVSIALLALVIVTPVFIILAALIKRDGGPVFYRQQRVARNGKFFEVLKLRSMEIDAEETVYSDPKLLKQYMHNYKIPDDPRVTRLGKLIRVTCLDELPQLINVIRGEMSIVGPRPVLYEETLMYGELKELILSMRPGMTGWWQVHRSEDVDYPARIQMEAWYVRHWSLVLDFRIVIETLPYIAAMVAKYISSRKIC